jgi:hypothetical protein
VLPWADTETRSVFLAEVSPRHPGEFIVLVRDGAGWHKAKHLQVPTNMKRIALPAGRPQRNPVEQVWDEVREKYFANRQLASRDQWEEQLVTGLAGLEADAPRLASLTGFDWITCVSLNAN